jgi:hypothetical protein
MKYITFTIVAIILFLVNSIAAQIEKVYVETYYITDKNDAQNSIGGNLQENTLTYRVYIKLSQGFKLNKIYGDKNHVFTISSSENIFNHSTLGSSLGSAIVKPNLRKDFVALDSWVTIGQTSRPSNGFTLFGIPKHLDTDGSLIGGANNDGGNSGIIGGLLKNNASSIGKPLTTSDGNFSYEINPVNIVNYGLVDPITAEQNTIFGKKIGNEFISNSFSLETTEQFKSIELDSNYILIAQITTKGTLKMLLNLEIQDKNGSVKKYVATKNNISKDEIYTPILSYPPVCSCSDSNYKEYDEFSVCQDNTKCKTKIKFGCMDSTACNYDQLANVHLDKICCYVGYCNDLDLDIICPDLTSRNGEFIPYLKLYPSLITDELNIEHNLDINSSTKLSIKDAFGRIILEKSNLSNANTENINLRNIPTGIYICQITSSSQKVSKFFTKI